MRYTVRAFAVLALALGAAPARAQNPGLPVYNRASREASRCTATSAFPTTRRVVARCSASPGAAGSARSG